jgi:hypothetical protein
MIKNFSAVIVFSFCFLFVSCKSKDKGGSGPAYTIKMRLANGDKFGQDLDMTMDMGIKMAAMNMDMKMNMNMTMDMEVLGDTGELKKLRFTYTKAKMSMDLKGVPGNGVNSNDLLDKAAARIEGKSINLLLNKNNEIVEVSGFEEMMTDSNEEDPAMREEMKKMFSKDQLNSMMGLMFQMYPDHPVRVGDTWEKESDMNMGPFKMRMKNKFRLKEANNGVAIIQVENSYSGKGKMEQGSVNADVDMDGKQKGEMGVRMDDGYLKGANYTLDVKAKAKIMGQTVPYDIHGNYLMKGH